MQASSRYSSSSGNDDPSSTLRIVAIVILLFLILAGGGTVAYFLSRKEKDGDGASTEVAVTTQTAEVTEEPSQVPGGEKESSKLPWWAYLLITFGSLFVLFTFLLSYLRSVIRKQMRTNVLNFVYDVGRKDEEGTNSVYSLQNEESVVERVLRQVKGLTPNEPTADKGMRALSLTEDDIKQSYYNGFSDRFMQRMEDQLVIYINKMNRIAEKDVKQELLERHKARFKEELTKFYREAFPKMEWGKDEVLKKHHDKLQEELSEWSAPE